MALAIAAFTPIASGNPSAVLQDFAAYIQNGDQIWVYARTSGVTTPTFTLTGSGYTTRHSSSFLINSNVFTLQVSSRNWVTGDPTALTVTCATNAQSVSARAIIVRSDFQSSGAWTVTGNVATQTPGGGNSLNPAFKQLTPVDANRDLRLVAINCNSNTSFVPLLPQGGAGTLYSNFQYLDATEGFIAYGYGPLICDAGDTTIQGTPNSQSAAFQAYTVSDGSTSGNYVIAEDSSDSELDASVPLESWGAGGEGLTSVSGRFEGGAHIY